MKSIFIINNDGLIDSINICLKNLKQKFYKTFLDNLLRVDYHSTQLNT